MLCRHQTNSLSELLGNLSLYIRLVTDTAHRAHTLVCPERGVTEPPDHSSARERLRAVATLDSHLLFGGLE